MPNINPLINKVSNFIKENNLINKDDKCLLGVSGGFDSTVMVDIVSKIKQLFKISDLAIAHVNYNLRGIDSINDKQFVENLANKCNLQLFDLDIDLNTFINSQENKDSLENIARQVRYDFFKDICDKNDFNKIVLAHNANDHAETILLKIIRGTVSGLKGIESKRKFNDSTIEIIRPLLCLSRKEIESYSSENNLNPRTDYSNLENDYTRNRIRNNILPMIISENPNFLDSIYNSSKVLSKENNYLDEISLEVINHCLINSNENQIILSYNKLKLNNDVIINRVIKNIFLKLKNDYKSFGYKHIEAIKNNIKENISKKIIELPNNYFFLKDRDYLIFSKGNIDLVPLKFEYALTDSYYIKEIDKNIEIIQANQDIFPNFNNLAFSIENINKIELKSYNEKEIFIPFEKTNTSSVKEIMDKKKIPELLRKDLVMIYINDLFLGIPQYIRSNNFLFETNSNNLNSYFFIVKP